MNGAYNILIKRSVISHKTYAFAVAFPDKKGWGTPVSRLVALNDDARSYILCDFRRGGFLKTVRSAKALMNVVYARDVRC